MDKQIDSFYKNWCKNTKRSGGILVGSSIRELLIDFYEVFKWNKMTNNLEKALHWWSKLSKDTKLEFIGVYFPNNKYKRNADDICTQEQVEDMYEKVVVSSEVKY